MSLDHTFKPPYAEVQKVSYSWEELCEIGRAAIASMNDKCWDLGALVLQACKLHSDIFEKQSVRDYAKELNISPRRARTYLQVWKKFHDIKDKFPQLTHSHFTEVVALDKERAIEWLKKAADSEWSSGRLRMEMRETKEIREQFPEMYTTKVILKGTIQEDEGGLYLKEEEGKQLYVDEIFGKNMGEKAVIIIKIAESKDDQVEQKSVF